MRLRRVVQTAVEEPAFGIGDLLPRLVQPGGHTVPVGGFKGSVRVLDPSKVVSRIMEDDLGKMDVTVPWKDINFVGANALSVGEHGRFNLSSHAFEQLCERLKIPSQYLQRCPVTGRAGRREQLEYWRDEADESEVLLRLKTFDKDTEGNVGDIRAILSKSYQPIDNLRLFGWVNDAIERDAGKLGMIYANLGKTSTHLRLCYSDPINFGTDDKPDPHYFGIHVSDSEVGTRALTMDYFLYRLVCLNGLIMPVEGDKLMHQKHIHVDYGILGREFRDAFTTAVEQREVILDQVGASRSTVVHNPIATIYRIVRHYKGSKEFAQAVVDAFEDEDRPSHTQATKFDITQALTRAARGLPMDRRSDIEAFAGKYLIEAA